MKRLFHLLTNPPTFTNASQNQMARILHYLLLLGIVLGAGFAILALPFSLEKEGPLISAGMATVFVVLFWLLQRRQLQFVSFSLIISS